MSAQHRLKLGAWSNRNLLGERYDNAGFRQGAISQGFRCNVFGRLTYR